MQTPFGKSSRILGWLYVVPALAFSLLFLLYPVVYNVINSLRTGQGISFGNFSELLHDPVFCLAFRNSILWVIVTTLIQMLFGFILAFVLENYARRFRVVLRTVLFLPMAVTPTVSAIVFGNIYAPQYGLLYGVFQSLGISDKFPTLLGDPHLATYAVQMVNIWQWLGFYVLMYSVGIASLDTEVLAAADVDGAFGWKRIRHVVWPMLRSTHWSLLVLGSIQALQQFPLIYLMTEGGPANTTQVLATYIFQKGFVENQMPFASAISVILLLLALLLAGLQLLATRGDFSIGGAKS
ncbi:MAG: sugar ABC transporter permease [Alicyclobacillus sp.]|nr:sugar ABC transporter permease [Alicyclobacillus sp.]